LSPGTLAARLYLPSGRSGENLNEHVFGERWPAADERQEMLEEAIAVIRQLWEGGYQTHRGKHYRVENARIYAFPDEPPPIAVAAAGPEGTSTRSARIRRASSSSESESCW
jgi:alkanesulfonate monooxygenase SsuD/methylene tetrahydromethanopterin reductase-like flavin-dependent oxidoreductase (luciferase family)